MKGFRLSRDQTGNVYAEKLDANAYLLVMGSGEAHRHSISGDVVRIRGLVGVNGRIKVLFLWGREETSSLWSPLTTSLLIDILSAVSTNHRFHSLSSYMTLLLSLALIEQLPAPVALDLYCHRVWTVLFHPFDFSVQLNSVLF